MSPERTAGQRLLQLSLGQKLFVYTSTVLVLLLLVTFLILEQSQSRQWESYLRAQSLSFARLATPELLKRFRGDFSAGWGGPGSGAADFLSVNRDLVAFAFYSSAGRPLYSSPPLGDFQSLVLPADPWDEMSDDPGGGNVRIATRTLTAGGRVLAVEIPAAGPAGDTLLVARYLFSYQAVDQRIAEVREHFLRILLVSVGCAFLLAAIVAKRLVRPIRALNQGVRAVAQGELQIRIHQASGDEIGALAGAFNEMAESLAASRAELTSKNEALEGVNRELRQMQESLVRAERLAAIGQLAAGVSHEIDNPVGIILGLSELMLEDCPPDDPRRDDLQTIIAECKRCRRITGGLLGFARSSTGRFEETDLFLLVNDVLDSLRPQKLFKNLEISLQMAQVPTIRVDSDKIRQVLVNLCLNAAQSMAGSGQLTVRLGGADHMLLLEVRDTGPGIAPELCDKIFEPFFSTKGRGEGTGLGLSICRRLIEDHGGRLTVDCRAAGGCFRIELPLQSTEKSFDKAFADSLG